MIAAIPAAVSAASTWRLFSDCTGLFGKSALAEGAEVIRALSAENLKASNLREGAATYPI
jgi:hypothetical protein